MQRTALRASADAERSAMETRCGWRRPAKPVHIAVGPPCDEHPSRAPSGGVALGINLQPGRACCRITKYDPRQSWAKNLKDNPGLNDESKQSVMGER